MSPIVGVGGPPPVQERILPCRNAVTKKIEPVAVDAELRCRLTSRVTPRAPPHDPPAAVDGVDEHRGLFLRRPRATPAGHARPLRSPDRPPRGGADPD